MLRLATAAIMSLLLLSTSVGKKETKKEEQREGKRESCSFASFYFHSPTFFKGRKVHCCNVDDDYSETELLILLEQRCIMLYFCLL